MAYRWQLSGRLILAGMASVGLMGCGALAQFDLGLPTLQLFGGGSSIQEIQRQPDLGATVNLQGEVGDRIPLISGQIYQLRDNTGAIWVLTANPLPQSGDRISIQGLVRYESIPLGGQEQGEVYIEEQERSGGR